MQFPKKKGEVGRYYVIWVEVLVGSWKPGTATQERGCNWRYKLTYYPHRGEHPTQTSGCAAQKQCLERKGPREEPWETPIFVEQVEKRIHKRILGRTPGGRKLRGSGVLAAKEGANFKTERDLSKLLPCEIPLVKPGYFAHYSLNVSNGIPTSKLGVT